jgi:mannose-1-phosphate guanylyltransferase
MTADNSHRYAVILAGGRGTRLWPISTAEQPKQFQALGDSRPLIAQTFERLAACVGDERIFVSTTAGYVDGVIASLPRLSPENLIVEPRPEGKPAAFLLIANRIHAVDPQAVVLSAASDSSVSPLSAFEESCARAFQFVESHPFWTTILGLRPSRADTSLGYIRANGAAMGVKGINVARDFSEKPTRTSAEAFVAEPDYFWNSSYYCFSVSTLLEAYEQAAPKLSAAVHSYSRTELDADYENRDGPAHELLPLIDGGWPIGVVACDFRWYDIGTWPSLYRALQDSQETKLITSGAHIDLDSDGALIVNDSSMTVVTAGLNDLAVIVSDSVVLVAPIRKLEDQPDTIACLQSKYAGLADQGEKTK